MASKSIGIQDGEFTMERARVDTPILENVLDESAVELPIPQADFSGYNSEYRAGLAEAISYVADTKANLEKLERMKEMQEALKSGEGFHHAKGNVIRQYEEWQVAQNELSKKRASKIGRLKRPTGKASTAEKENEQEQAKSEETGPVEDDESFKSEDNISEMYKWYKELQELMPTEQDDGEEGWGKGSARFAPEDPETEDASYLSDKEAFKLSLDKKGITITAPEGEEAEQEPTAEDAFVQEADGDSEPATTVPAPVERVNEWDRQVYGFEWEDEELDLWEQGVSDACDDQIAAMRAEMQTEDAPRPSSKKDKSKPRRAEVEPDLDVVSNSAPVLITEYDQDELD